MAPKKATQAQRNELRADAREAASTGSLTQRQVNQLTNAGVNTANIRSIQQINKAAQTPAPTPAPAQNLSRFINTSAGGTAGTLGLSAVQQALSSGISQKDLTSQAQSQGLSFGPGAQSFLNQQPAATTQSPRNLSQFIDTSAGGTAGSLGAAAVQKALDSGLSRTQVSKLAADQGLNLGSAAQQMLTPTLNDAEKLGQALRIAGADQNISKGELQRINTKFGTDAAQAVRRMDKINTKSKEKGRALKIGLGQGALQSLINTGNTYTSGIFRESQFGKGRIGRTVQDYINASNPTGGYQNPQSGYSTFKPVRKDRERAAAQMAAGLMPLQRGGGMQINSKGGLTIKPGVLTKAATQPLGTPKPPGPLDPTKPEIKPEDLGDGGSPGGSTTSGGGGADTVTTNAGTEDILQQMEQEAATQDQSFGAFTSSNIGSWKTRNKKKGKGIKTTRTAKASERSMPRSATLG